MSAERTGRAGRYSGTFALQIEERTLFLATANQRAFLL